MLKCKCFYILCAFILTAFCGNAQKQERPVFKMVNTPNPQPGSIAPDFSLQNSHGEVIELSKYRGKIVILDIWATWCGPCMKGLPVLDSISNRLKNSGVVMLAICCADSKKNFENYVKKNKTPLSCELIFDPESTDSKEGFRNAYGINGFPTTMVIDRDGRIKGYGYTHDEIEMLLNSTIGKEK